MLGGVTSQNHNILNKSTNNTRKVSKSMRSLLSLCYLYEGCIMQIIIFVNNKMYFTSKTVMFQLLKIPCRLKICQTRSWSYLQGQLINHIISTVNTITYTPVINIKRLEHPPILFLASWFGMNPDSSYLWKALDLATWRCRYPHISLHSDGSI